MDTALRADLLDADERALLDTGHHYNYIEQRWVQGHDHAHFESQDSPLVFCGADAETCRKGHPELWA